MKNLQILAGFLVAVSMSSFLSASAGSVTNNTYQKLKLQFYSAAQPTKALPADSNWPSYFVNGKKMAGAQSTMIPSNAVVLELRYSDKAAGYSSGGKTAPLYSWNVSPMMSYTITGDISKNQPYVLTGSSGNVVAAVGSAGA